MRESKCRDSLENKHIHCPSNPKSILKSIIKTDLPNGEKTSKFHNILLTKCIHKVKWQIRANLQNKSCP